MIQYFEKINLKKKDSLNLPESIFIRPSITLVFDNVNDKLFISKVITPDKNNALTSYKKAKSEVLDLINKLNKPLKKR